VDFLDQFGAFKVRGVGWDDLHMVASHPAFAGLTDALLSNWGSSTHAAFTSFPASGPSSFTPLSIQRGVTGNGALTFGDGSSGTPYLLARGEGLLPVGLNISKSGPATANVGNNITYTITYGNTGGTNATSVVITDPVPTGTTFVSASGGGSLSGGNVVWNIGSLNAGVTGQTVTFTVTLNAPGTITNSNYTIAASGVSPVTGTSVNTTVSGTSPLTITGIDPNKGPISGGQTVTITGTNLTGFSSVTFGGTAATCPGPNTATSLICTTPAHIAGTVDVAVTTVGGTGTMTNAYTFVPPPTIVSVSPNRGPVAGGTVVTISGANLTGAGFSFGGIAADCSINAEGNQATCTTPAHIVGLVNVVVSSWGGNMTLSNVYSYVYGATLPSTGFAPGRITALPPQSVSYADLGDLWLEIPKLGVQIPIVGIPQSANGEWDVSWLGNDAGWLNGTAFPTWAGNSVLTGHVWNADNTAGPFANLNQLWYGDKVIVHAWGGQYVYEVRSVLQVSPWSTGAMMKHQELPWLTLVSCRGYDETSDTYKYRVLVRAVLMEAK
jgi:LPXTG-site transpeptidase (sortase) family protein